MSRRKKVITRHTLPDPKYNSIDAARFISYLLRRGKKSIAENVFYEAIEIVEETKKTNGIDIFRKAVNNVSPVMEVKSRRIGGATYQVPVEVKPSRRFALASRWIITFAKARPGKSMAEKLSAEFIAAAGNEGGSIKKKEDTHRMAEANKAFAHYK